MHCSGTVNANEQLKGNNREYVVHDLIAQIPKIYYKDIAPTKQIIVDKCRSWTIADNVTLLQKYIDPAIKIIVLERSVTAIMKSFMKLYQNNNWSESYIHEILKALLLPNAEPIMRSISGINLAKKNNAANTFLFIQYDDLIAQPSATLARIYEFCGWEPFAHQFTDVVNAHPENDAFYKLEGFHAIRSSLSKEANTVCLPPDIAAKCKQIDLLMGYN